MGHAAGSGLHSGKLLPNCLQARHGDEPVAKGLELCLPAVDGTSLTTQYVGVDACTNKGQNGGLYCDKGGVATKPFPDRPLCVEGTGAVQAVNKAGKTVAFCQTTLPGDEAMVIPTAVDGTVTIAVPGPNYWAATASQYVLFP